MYQEKKGPGCFGYAFWFLLSVVLCVIVAGISFDFDKSGGSQKNYYSYQYTTNTSSNTAGTSTDSTTDNTDSGGGTATVVVDTVERLYYPQLSETEKIFYDGLVDAVAKGELSCSFDDIPFRLNVDEPGEVIYAIWCEHPEYFWLSSGGKWTYRDNGNGTFDITITLRCWDFWNYTINPSKYVDPLMEKVNEISALAKQQPTVFDQVRFVHDYIVTNVEYNTDAAADNNSSVRKTTTEYANTAYGCLVAESAICGGYAKAFQLIMLNMGIECHFIVGSAGGPHAWNMIELEGEYYYLDVTWDDYDRMDAYGNLEYPSGVDYGYFCITTNQLNVTHIPDESDFTMPVCTATAYNYHVHEDSYLTDYDFNEFSQGVANQAGQQIISVRFASEGELNEAYEDLLRNGRGANISALTGAQVEIDRTRYIITYLKK